MALMTPAVAHALLVGNPHTAAAIHVLDGICSPVFPRGAVTMGGIDWAAIGAVRPALSSGETALSEAAEDLDLCGRVGGLTLTEVRRRVDVAGNGRVDEAMRMAGQRIPLSSGPAVPRGSGPLPGRDILDQDPMLDDTVRESIWPPRRDRLRDPRNVAVGDGL